MALLIEKLRKLVEKGGRYREVDAMTIYKELNFIERHHLENYFLVAHKLVAELKKDSNVIIGPGWGRMISSHVCYSLGITNISPVSVGVGPILIWGDKNKVPTIYIEVDEESYYRVFQKAIELFGYENVARMPVNVGPNQDLSDHSWIGTNANGEKVYFHACALLICLNGVENHFCVEEVTDEKGNVILCTKDFIEDCDNQLILRYNILQSSTLTRIKRIKNLIEKKGNEYPGMYDRPIEEEDYTLFYHGDLNDILDFDNQSIQKVTKMLMPNKECAAFEELINIQGLFTLGEGNSLMTEEMVAEYKQKHRFPVSQNQFPYGFLFAEDAAWFIHYWTGLTWKHTVELLQYVFEKDEKKAEPLWTHSLFHARDNGFKRDDSYRILCSLFNRPLIRSKAHYAGRLYLSVYLAGLKHRFPKEFEKVKE